MAKTDNLTDFLTDLADGIRAVEGTTALIDPQDFRERVEGLTKPVLYGTYVIASTANSITNIPSPYSPPSETTTAYFSDSDGGLRYEEIVRIRFDYYGGICIEGLDGGESCYNAAEGIWYDAYGDEIDPEYIDRIRVINFNISQEVPIDFYNTFMSVVEMDRVPYDIGYSDFESETYHATATAANILKDKTAYVDGSLITGTMTNRGAVSKSLAAGGSYTIPAGYHSGSGKVTANSLSSQTVGDATTTDILSGKTAWVNGTKVTGEYTPTYTLYGSYMLSLDPYYPDDSTGGNEDPDYEVFDMSATAAYAHFYDSSTGEYSYEAISVIDNADNIISENGLSTALIYPDDYPYWAPNGEVTEDFPDVMFRIIDILTPVEVPKWLYDRFTNYWTCYNEPDYTTPYDIGYSKGISNASIEYDSNTKTLTITT